MQNALNTIKLQKFSHQCIQLKEKKKKEEEKKGVIKFFHSPPVLHVSDMSGPVPARVLSP